MSYYTIHRFKNGPQVILSPLNETKAVTVLVLVKVGSRYEVKNINGISHFIEHMMFKGTKRRPNTQVLSRELDAVGAEYNAFTSKDHTGYYIKIAARQLDLALDMLSDMLIYSKFEEKELNRERGVIIEEINMYEDNPLMFAESFFEELLFAGNPLGWQISGPRQVIAKVTRKQMIAYKNKFYRPANFFISVAGSFSPEKVLSKVKTYFSASTPTLEDSKKLPEFKNFNYRHQRPRLKIKYKETEQVQLVLGLPGLHHLDKRIYALGLLSVILGGNMSSRLFINIRERKGLCYFIRANHSTYEDTGAFIIQAGLDNKRVKIAVGAILEELTKIKEKGVTEEELKRAKDFIQGKMTLELEDSSSVADWYGKQLIFKERIEPPQERFKKFRQVTKEEVGRLARQLFKTQLLNLALIGPFKEREEFAKLLKV